MSEIKPALTAEEWRTKSHYPVNLDPFNGDLRISAEDGVVSIEESDRHAIGALALYGQPFGFSRDDVEALRSVGEYMAFDYNELADRISALLPPEEK